MVSATALVALVPLAGTTGYSEATLRVLEVRAREGEALRVAGITGYSEVTLRV